MEKPIKKYYLTGLLIIMRDMYMYRMGLKELAFHTVTSQDLWQQ
jgi:hypothetical protein